MGCDIYAYVEVRRAGHWTRQPGDEYIDGDMPFGWRNYAMFGFLADVRNYSHSPVISEPRGLPDDVSTEVLEQHNGDNFSTSWLLVAELLAYDYDQVFWDRRVTKEIGPGCFDGAALAEDGEGEHPTIRDFLGPGFFADLATLAKLADPADVRVVFWFSF